MKILIVCLRPLHDVLAATPLALALHAAHPGAEIDLVVEASVHALVATSAHYRTVFGYDRRGRHRDRRQASAFMQALRAQRYDLAINLTDHERAGWMTVLSGARRRCGIAPSGAKVLFAPALDATHGGLRTEAFRAFAAALGTPVATDLGCGDADAAAEALWAPFAGRPVVGVHVACDPPSHRWPVERWVGLLEAVESRGWQPVLLASGAEPGPAADVRFLTPQAVPLLGADQPLEVLVALIRRCAAVISSQHPLLHVAAEQGVPFCAILRPADLTAYGAYTTPHQLLYRQAQHCCETFFCSTSPCLRRIAVDDVVEAVEQLLPVTHCRNPRV
jgi:ADP-heptose:LPS heptosyltransferase